jgi:hypothetical protein
MRFDWCVQSDDMATLLDLAAYLNNTGGGADGRHAAIDNWCAATTAAPHLHRVSA